MAHSSPVYLVDPDGQARPDPEAIARMMALVEHGREYVTDTASIDVGADVLHGHYGDHMQHLLAPFDQAKAALKSKSATIR